MRIGWLIGTAVLLSCGPPWGPPPDPNELMKADRAFAEATAARGAEGWAESFAENGRMYDERGFVDGRAAIREAIAPTFADSTTRLRWEPDTAIVAASGDLAYTLGHWECIGRGAGGDSLLGRGN